jgi:hypothetical protein
MLVHVDGVGLWGPGLFDWPDSRAILRGETEFKSAVRPAPASELLAAAERRRAPTTVRLAMRVAQAACAEAQVSASTLASVFASSQGDTEITDYMCRELAVPGTAISPTKFHNSVHNAASGYWTIATGCTLAASAISGYRESFACGLLEAASCSVADNNATLLAAYDIVPPLPMATVCPVTASFGVALVLSPVRTRRSLAQLRIALTAGERSEPALPRQLENLRDSNPIARCLPLLVTLAQSVPATIDLKFTDRQMLTLEITPWT